MGWQRGFFSPIYLPWAKLNNYVYHFVRPPDLYNCSQPAADLVKFDVSNSNFQPKAIKVSACTSLVPKNCSGGCANYVPGVVPGSMFCNAGGPTVYTDQSEPRI